MRGTILRLKRHSFDLSSVDGDAEEETKTSHSISENQKSSLHFPNLPKVENKPQDVNKNILMSNLELQSTSSMTRSENHLSNQEGSPFHRPVFDWDDDNMWKAMSKHPLFFKYMELQSQLNNLFEEIRLDCKKAACERAFTSLIKETAESPIQATSVILSNPMPTDTPPKKRGRPLKRKPGRPRKIVLSNPSADCNNDTTETPNKSMRKCRDELFLSRKPTWICVNCAKRFSSAGWLDRHKSVCSFSKLPNSDNSAVDENLDVSKPSSHVVPEDNHFGLGEGGIRFVRPGVPLSSLRAPMFAVTLNETPESLPLSSLPTHSTPVSPLQPKMDNRNCPDDDEVFKKQLCDEESRCSEVADSIISCGKCKQQFPVQAHLKRHWEEFSDCKLYASHHGNDGESEVYMPGTDDSACKHCGKSFRKHKLLKRHQSMCHVKSKEKRWQCIYCYKAFSSPKRHDQHQKKCFPELKTHGRQAQRCENCSLLFPTQKRLLKHQAVCCPDSNNHMVKLLKCLKCSLVFPTSKKQLKHRAVCCPDRETEAKVCSHCSKVLVMPDRMAAHKKKCVKTAKKFQ